MPATVRTLRQTAGSSGTAARDGWARPPGPPGPPGRPRGARGTPPPPADQVAPCQVHPDHESRPGEQRLNTGRGSVVDPVDRAIAAAARHVERKGGHEDGRGDRADDGDHEKALRTAAAHDAPPEHGHDDERPDQVELLLHAQRPHVQQRRRVGEGREVALPSNREVPVRRIEERREGVTAHPRQGRRRRSEPPDDGDRHQDEQQRGQQPARPPDPEVTQRDGAGTPLLAQQQTGDQVAGEHEEHVDAQEAAAGPCHARVVEHDGGDGECPQPVQRGQVRLLPPARTARDVSAPVRPQRRSGAPRCGRGRAGRGGLSDPWCSCAHPDDTCLPSLALPPSISSDALLPRRVPRPGRGRTVAPQQKTHMAARPRRWGVVRRGFQRRMWRIFAPLVFALPVAVAITSALSPQPSPPRVNPPRVATHVEAVVGQPGATAGVSAGFSAGGAVGASDTATTAGGPTLFR